jgi:hypothetical protein
MHPATTDSVMKNASGKSGRASRAIAAHPRQVERMSPASTPVDSSDQRRPTSHARTASPKPENAAGNRAEASPTPPTANAAAAAQ